MAKAKNPASAGQLRSFNGLIVSGIDEKILEQIEGSMMQHQIDDPENFNKKFIAWMNNDCRLNIITDQHFIVGDVFRHHGGEGYTPMYIWEGAQTLLFIPNKDRVVAINKTICKLRDYTLSEDMNDSKIQKNAKSVPMTEDEFFLVLFLLIIKPELSKEVLGYELDKSKYYLFHVKLASGKVVTLYLRWDGDEWRVRDYAFDSPGAWDAGRVLLYFATAK